MSKKHEEGLGDFPNLEPLNEAENPIVTNKSETPLSPYSIFTKPQKRIITLLIGLAMMFSPLTANIYLPCIPVLEQQYHTTTQNINLTITAYIVLQGIAPAFFGELSDKVGRRPVYLLGFSIYFGASIGLALQDNYSALLILRMLQSIGASVPVALGYGVVADVASPAERGTMLGPAMVTTNLGPVLGPLIGGPLAQNAGWRWVFWFLSIAGGTFLLVIALLLPETCRNIVGNGSIDSGKWNKPMLPYLYPKVEVLEREWNEPEPLSVRFFRVMPNPMRSFRLILEKDTSMVLLLAGIFYMMYYIVQASLPPLFIEYYGLDETQIGLCYLALSFGVIFGGFMNARVMDWNYRMTAKALGVEVDKVRGDDLGKFPIERARARLAEVFMLLRFCFVLGYGWSLRQHIAIPLIIQFFIGLLGINQSFNTLLVEIHRDSASTAAASGNIARCALAAGGVAVMSPLISKMGVGPFFSLVAGVTCLGGVGLVWLIRFKGMKWRLERDAKRSKKELAKSRKGPNSKPLYLKQEMSGVDGAAVAKDEERAVLPKA
ncbi:putative MFS transporter [Amylocarpus encephaloides]|uniref:MFS transporter n=1 Tax=Amylocarpus encephaloides TaxID=45428 RepID=A0A9P7YHP8_9HELO|nr:putative MFS transporter [Amylocarpus encephaloides]